MSHITAHQRAPPQRKWRQTRGVFGHQETCLAFGACKHCVHVYMCCTAPHEQPDAQPHKQAFRDPSGETHALCANNPQASRVAASIQSRPFQAAALNQSAQSLQQQIAEAHCPNNGSSLSCCWRRLAVRHRHARLRCPCPHKLLLLLRRR